jgi:eukaryotic-like serine/threonine-protein kinase
VAAPSSPPASRLQFSIASPTPAALPRQALTPLLAIAPDGQRIAVADNDGLWLWAGESGGWEMLPDTAGATAPFFSPDGAHVAFFARGELRRIATAGGPPSLIARAPAGNAGTWSRDGTILYSRWLGEDAGLWLVPARGGDARLLAPAPNPIDLQAFPSWLPDNRHYVFVQGAYGKPLASARSASGRLTVASPSVAAGDSLPMYSGSGHLVFVRAGALVALPFDAASLQAMGEATTIEREVRWFGPTGVAHFAVSADGRALVHATAPVGQRLEWISRTGSPWYARGRRALWTRRVVALGRQARR